ncbi:MAG TPA: NnrS family protein [Fimbriimonadaceae bacterium]|nr:NnrS family protein [Fimbriimonadaceae bacterium]
MAISERKLIPLRQQKVGPPADQRVVTEIYRPFFLAGILSVLTAGCLLGAVALLGIAIQGSYTASAWTPYVLAHANSQLYGWVGFFVIGFALQQHAPRQSRSDLFHRMAAWSLGLMAVGIGLRFAAEPLVRVDPTIWMPVGIASCLLQAMAIGIFMLTIRMTRFNTGEGLSWQTGFVYVALFWWSLVALAEPFFFAQSHGPGGVAFVAKWFSPYREAQFLGFVAMMIFGVALVKLSSCFGAKAACPVLGRAGLAVWNVGLLLRMTGWVLHADSDFTNPMLWYVGGLLIFAGAVILVLASRLFSRLGSELRSHKFIRAAFGWLLVSGLLLVLEPLHLVAIGDVFSHAYTGAIRHAVTVGFISQMIVGVSLHVVARMNDLDDRRLPSLWSVFWLLNLGNAARVGLEIATDYSGSAFLPMGVTGFVELTALLIWAVHVAKPMLSRPSPAHVS